MHGADSGSAPELAISRIERPNGVGGQPPRSVVRKPRRSVRPAISSAGRISFRPPGNRERIRRSGLSACSGCRYGNMPSAVMNTPFSRHTRSIQLKSSADWAHIVMRGDRGSRRSRSSTFGGRSTVSQRNYRQRPALSRRQKLVCIPSPRATTVLLGGWKDSCAPRCQTQAPAMPVLSFRSFKPVKS